MNERIRELAEQATQELANRPKGMSSMPRIITKEEFNEKFALLIVREVLKAQEKLISEGHNAWHLHEPTKKHFGVD